MTCWKSSPDLYLWHSFTNSSARNMTILKEAWCLPTSLMSLIYHGCITVAASISVTMTMRHDIMSLHVHSHFRLTEQSVTKHSLIGEYGIHWPVCSAYIRAGDFQQNWYQKRIESDTSPWGSLFGSMCWYLSPLLLSHCNSFDDRAPVDEIYGCPIFKCVAVTWLNERVPV